MLFSISEYYCAMSDMNTAFIDNDSANDLITNVACGDGVAEELLSANTIVDSDNEREQCFMTNTNSLAKKPSLDGEDCMKECLWETFPTKIVKSHVSKRKLHHSEGQQLEIESGHSGECKNDMKRKTRAKSKDKRSAKNKTKVKNYLAEKLNADCKKDLCLPFDTTTLQAQDADMPTEVSTVTHATRECKENIADRMTELLARFEQSSNTQQDSVGVCRDADGGFNLLQTGLPDSDVLNDDIVCHKDCRIKMELLIPNATLCQDLNITKNAVGIQPSMVEHLPSSVDESISGQKWQKKLKVKKCNQSKNQCTKAGLSLVLEQQNDRHDCNEPGGLSAVEERERCAQTAAVLPQGMGKTIYS